MDLKQKIRKEPYLQLKAIVKANSAAGKALRLAAEDNKGYVRYVLRDMKREHGCKSRTYHLAYAFIRGRKHSEIERNVVVNKSFKDYFIKSIKGIITSYADYKYCRTELDSDLEAFFDIEEQKKAA